MQNLPISQVRVVSDWIFLAGQGSLDHQSQIVGSTIEEQTRQTLANIDALLRGVGAELADVVAALVHLSDLKLFDGYNRVWDECFPDPKPTRTTVEARLLRGLLVEVTVVASRQSAPNA
ncbi:MAG TPA: RidA family protein [Gaiellaceae bacterium]|nr:RidA family protein [Gaiellaceae bacterium]